VTKGEQTRQRIIARAAPVFNVHGYFGASMNDLTRETKIGKGGIYNHFESKEALAVKDDPASNWSLMRARLPFSSR